MGRSLLAALALAGFGGGEPPDGRLVLGVHGQGEWAAVADARTGEVHKRRLAGGTLCHGPLLVVGDRVVFSGHRGGRAVARALPLALTGPARVVGPGQLFTPSPGEPALWLGSWTRHDRTTVLFLREVRPDGTVLVRARALLPRIGMLHAALSRAFVVTSGRWLIVWDVFRDLPIRIARDAWFVAGHQRRFAWCRDKCRALRLWSPRGESVLEMPPGVRPLGAGGAFSPDGTRLATGVLVDGRPRVAVVNLGTWRWTVVPGALRGHRAIAWSPSGRWLYFTDSDQGLRAWNLGAQSSSQLPVHPGGTVMSIAPIPAATSPAAFSPL
jgi:WD40-like Beta Propeller Repeat